MTLNVPPDEELGFHGTPFTPPPTWPVTTRGPVGAAAAPPVPAALTAVAQAVQRAHAATLTAHQRYLALLRQTPAPALRWLTGPDPTGGAQGRGRADAVLHLAGPDPLPAVRAFLAEYATRLDLTQYLPAPSLHGCDDPDHTVELFEPLLPGRPLTAVAELRRLTLTPRPRLVADVTLLAGDRAVGRVLGAGVRVVEGPGSHLAATEPPPGRPVPARRCADGRPARANEFHMALLAEGDITEALGTPGLALARVRTRLPRGDMLMLHRSPDPARPYGDYPVGTAMTTEYDVPLDPWYVRDNGHAAFPLLALLEIALQGAAFVGIAHGMILEHPDQDWMVRNLKGSLTLRYLPELCGRTVTQRSTLLSHAALPEAKIQRYAFELSTDGEVFCSGETAYGCYPADAMTEPNPPPGPDTVPPWLHLPNAPVSTLRLPGRTESRLGRGRLALLDEIELVHRGGEHGLGYALSTAEIDPEAWYFEQHFFNDPVTPGSLGIEMLHQALRAYTLHSGLVDDMPEPRLTVGTGHAFSWGYRGQILSRHRTVHAEVHLTAVTLDGDALTVRADGTLWRDGLRVYRAAGLSVVARPGTAPRSTP
ncbi:3-hydroxyacyl-ACP dehydratase [Streptomyces sp. NPDC087294]|uniref:3-hydroxyacyl-ACP dehydratase n=1 Tax=Streptomyces sp. NPDC087294 TaxID=3365777 RepID=UPI0037FEBFA4